MQEGKTDLAVKSVYRMKAAQPPLFLLSPFIPTGRLLWPQILMD